MWEKFSIQYVQHISISKIVIINFITLIKDAGNAETSQAIYSEEVAPAITSKYI